MNLIKCLPFLFMLLFIQLDLTAQGEKYSRIKVFLGEQSIEDLDNLGIEADHGKYAPGRYLINEFSESEIDLIENAGFEYEVIVDDLIANYILMNSQGAPIKERTVDCSDSGMEDSEVPVNYTAGSLGGYFTYQEMLDNLDAMATQYPNLISPRAEVSDVMTHEGRPLYWVKISDNPNQDETDEPEALYTALHHAREPNSLSQMIYFMWYVLENYENDEELQFLLNNSELYFMPCVNPDGYLFNEANYPDSYWRKNRRDNGDGTYGVDLNRNYGYEWAFDNNGSSPNPSSQTYRGPGPFSEPETQNVKIFCEAHEFQIGLNYHTYGNLLIYPWGFSDSPTSEANTFFTLADAMTKENNYFAGTGSETVGYTVNGTSDDWMYGEELTKPKIYSMTPEVGPGSYGFWPPSFEVINLNKTALQQNITTARLLHNYGVAEEQNDYVLEALDNDFDYTIKKFGLKEGILTVSITALSNNVESIGAPVSHDLAIGESDAGTIAYTLTADIAGGEEVKFLFSVDDGDLIRHDTITQLFGTSTPIFVESGDNFDNWENSSADSEWAVTTNEFHSAPSSITDSPNGQYDGNTYNEITLSNSIDLAAAESATLRYWAKWDIEAGYDFVQILLSNDGQNWTPACGKYTHPGNSDQAEGEPLYDGSSDWVLEEIDLSDCIGGDLHIKFVLESDGGLEMDGFYFDDMEVLVIDNTVKTVELSEQQFELYQNRPNPARDYTIIAFNSEIDLNDAQLLIYNSVGVLMQESNLSGDNFQRLEVATDQWPAGIYFYQVKKANEVTPLKKMTILK